MLSGIKHFLVYDGYVARSARAGFSITPRLLQIVANRGGATVALVNTQARRLSDTIRDDYDSASPPCDDCFRRGSVCVRRQSDDIDTGVRRLQELRFICDLDHHYH
jgi:hypothetical protein